MVVKELRKKIGEFRQLVKFSLLFFIVQIRSIFINNKRVEIKNIVWYGAYGNTNLGDDLIFFALRQYIPDHVKIRLSCRQKELLSDYYGVEMFYRGTDLSQYRRIKDSDLVLLGGGGLFEFYKGQFPISSLISYMYPLLMARYYRKPYLIVGMGCNIDPFPNIFLRHMFSSLINNASLIIARDQKSYQGFLNNSYIKTIRHLISSFDPVFSLQNISHKGKKKEGTKKVGFLLWPYYLHPYFHKSTNLVDISRQVSPEQLQKHRYFCEELRKVFSILDKENYQIIFPLFHFSDKILLDELGCSYEDDISFHSYFEQLTSCDIVISMRYHGQITALANNIPLISIVVQEKMSALIKNFELDDYYIDISDFNSVDCVGVVNRVYENRVSVKEHINEKFDSVSNDVKYVYKSNLENLFVKK